MTEQIKPSIGITPTIIKQLKDEFSLRASKALGQNFLVDANICYKIASLISGEKTVVEVGPGVGSLTVALAGSGLNVRCIEYDEHILAPLNFVLDHFKITDQIEIDNEDVLEVDLNQVLKDINSNTVVGNLPYNIAATLVMKIAQEYSEAKTIIAMVQKEVAERFCSPLKSRAVSGVTLKSRFFMDAQMCFDVPRTVFMPAPNVDSSVMKLTRKENPYEKISEEEVPSFFKLIDAGFSMRRKMLRQSLKPLLGKSVGKILNASGVEETLRAEQCDLDDFISIYQASKV